MKKTFVHDIIHNKYFITCIIFFSYLLIDIFFRYYTIKAIYFYSIRSIAPILFSLSIITLNVLIINILPKKVGTIYYIVSFLLNLIFGLVNFFHYKILGSFFTFSELFLMGEGLEYKSVIFTYISLKLVIAFILIILVFALAIFLLIKNDLKYSNKKLIILVIAFQLIGVIFLFINNNGYPKDNSYSPIYNYTHFETPHRSIQVVGILQYNIQDIIMYYKGVIKEKIELNKYRKIMDDYFDNKESTTEKNKYSGIFKGKNLIYIMIETGDDWLITKEDMPTLYKLKNEGLNFTNRYAPFFCVGYTINSEFAANTGYYLADGFDDYMDNYYPYSLPNLFKNAGYVVNSFHMNNGEFYHREVLHNSLGYEHYYGNYYNQEYMDKGFNYVNDVCWIDNEETYNLLVPKIDENYMSFLVTYSMHLPFINNGICEQAIRAKKIFYKPWEKREEICLRFLALQTDEMLRKLLENLENEKLLDDVVLVLFADHDAYGFSDKKYLSEVKGTDNIYLQQKTPLIIWSRDIEHEDIDILMDTADLVPTLANMFGLEYDSKYYLSTDVFSSTHDDYVYFRSGFVLDSDNNFIDNGSNNKGKEMINYNKYLLKTDYFRKAN